MFKQLGANSATHRFGQDPEMIKARPIILIRQQIKTNNSTVLSRTIGNINRYEFGGNCEDIAPSAHPLLRVSPMPLGSVSNRRQVICFIWFGTDNFDLGGPVLQICTRSGSRNQI